MKSLVFNTLSRFVIAFLPRSKHLLISWLQSSSAIILEPKKIKFVTASLVAQMVKHLHTTRETWVRSLGWEDPLEEGMATHSSSLAWRIPGTCIVHGVTKSQTRLSDRTTTKG